MTDQIIEKALASLSVSSTMPTQVLIITNDNSSSNKALMNAYDYSSGKWQQAFGPLRCMLGRNGFAAPGEKREGDGKTPSGVFSVGTAFGYDRSVKTRLPFRQVTEDDKWIDDVDSDDYNKWIFGETKASSFEKMKRSDHLYKYGFVVEYNTGPIVKGLGSAIFVHVWRADGKPTSGCISLSEQDILKVLEWLDASRNPKVVMGRESDLSNL